MRVSELLSIPAVKILLYLHSKGQVRHADLEKMIASRGTLASNLNDLLDEGLVARKVISAKPIQSNYSLTEKGRNVVEQLAELERLLK